MVVDTLQMIIYFARKLPCRLFIGSDVATEVGMPSKQALRDALKRELQEMGVDITSITEESVPALAQSVSDISRPRLLQILQYEFEKPLSNQPWKQGAYPFIPRLPSKLTKIIYTTTWDELLKRAFEEAGKPVMEVRYPEPYFEDRVQIVKVCGDFTGDLIVAKEDYNKVTQQRVWSHLERELQSRNFFFIGYTPDDPEIDLIRPIVKSLREGGPRHFLVGRLSESDAQLAMKCTGMCPLRMEPTTFFQILVRDLNGMGEGIDE